MVPIMYNSHNNCCHKTIKINFYLFSFYCIQNTISTSICPRIEFLMLRSRKTKTLVSWHWKWPPMCCCSSLECGLVVCHPIKPYFDPSINTEWKSTKIQMSASWQLSRWTGHPQAPLFCPLTCLCSYTVVHRTWSPSFPVIFWYLKKGENSWR